MKTLTLKALGRDVEVFFTLNHYSMNNNLCINMVAVNEGPWSTLTTNFDVNLEPDEAFIDTNNNAGIDEILVANGIAEPTGRGIRSGFCIYPLFKFNLDVVEQYTCVCNKGLPLITERRKSMFAIFRTKGNLTQDISFDCDAFEYYTSKKIAENIASELTEIWNEKDAVGHPWYDSKFHVENVSEEYIRRKNEVWALRMAHAEMAV